MLQQDMPEREALLTVPLANALIIADEPVSGISIFSDRQHRQWQELHGELPPMLLEFLQGEVLTAHTPSSAHTLTFCGGLSELLCRANVCMCVQVTPAGTRAWQGGSCGWCGIRRPCGVPT